MNGINAIARAVVKIEVTLAVRTESDEEIIMASERG